MKLLSTINMSGFDYYVVLEDTTGAQKWFLYSVIHPDNFLLTGSDRYENSLNIAKMLKEDCRDYLLESITISKTTGVVKYSIGRERLTNIFNSFVEARDYSYPDGKIMDDTDEFTTNRVRSFSASSGSYSMNYKQVDNVYQTLRFSTDQHSLSFTEVTKLKLVRKLSYTEVPREVSHVAKLISVKKVNYEVLKGLMDLSWYQDPVTGEIIKDYYHVSNVPDLESRLITPMVKEIMSYGKREDICLIAMDTETTGFKLLYLDQFNTDIDTVSTMQFSWKDNQGVLINMDMKYFDNIEREYVFKRLYPLFNKDKSDFKFTLLYDEQGNEINTEVTLKKSWYHLVGHNTIFDSRASKSAGYQYFFDEDTLQMAFNINPTKIKGSKGLKDLTRFFLNHETPELSDLLGKGNEGRFRYLSDIKVAEIYGCADVDYTRLVWKKLRQLMTDKMYSSYRALDPYTWYMCAGSEYYGIRLKEEFIHTGSENIKKDLNSIKDLIFTYVGSCMYGMSKLDKMINSTAFSDNSLTDAESGIDDRNRFEFNISGADIRKVMYDNLKYPVLVRTDKGMPAVNKEAMTKLMFQTNKESSNFMKKDLVSCAVNSKGKSNTLVSAEKFNSYKYPLCYLLSQYKVLEKEYSSFYKPFEQSDLEGRLFKGISTTNIETRRISSPVQTIKKDLKQAIVSHEEDWYLCDWDLNQVEARIFVSEAGDETLISKMHDPEKDYHTENASLMFQIPAHLVPKPVRAKAKAVGFGIPYGLSDFKLCERLFTIASNDKMIETRMLRYDFEKANKACMEKLISYRKSATVPVDLERVLASQCKENYSGPKYTKLEPSLMAQSLREFWRVSPTEKLGMVFNKNGFYRYFKLDQYDNDPKGLASVERAAGNFPIQSFAADLFRVLLKRFMIALDTYGIADKVVFHMYIHDELLFSVHKSVDPDLITKICAEACMVRLPKHTSYFIGLNYGSTWYECKQDESELPPLYMLDVKNRIDSTSNYEYREWVDNPKTIYAPEMFKFKLGRILSVFNEYYESNSHVFDYNNFISHFDNYTVRSYVYDIKVPEGIKVKGDNDLEFFFMYMNALKLNNLNTLKVTKDGITHTVSEWIEFGLLNYADIIEVEEDIDLFADDIEEDFVEEDDDFWSFDEDDSGIIKHVISIKNGDEEELPNMDIIEPEFKFIKKMGSRIVIKVNKSRNINAVKKFLEKYKVDVGTSLRIETLIGSELVRGQYNIDKSELDKYLEEVNR